MEWDDIFVVVMSNKHTAMAGRIFNGYGLNYLGII